MVVPSLTPLPSPPLPTDPEAVFDEKAGNSLTAQVTFTHDMNDKVIPAINAALVQVDGDKTTAEASALAAGDSATEATWQVELAAQQVTLATEQAEAADISADLSRAYANAAGAAVGFPDLSDPFDVLMINGQKNGVIWGKVGQEIGDVLITERATPPPGYVLPSTLYSQAAYPELFALTGILEVNNDGVNFSPLPTPPTIGTIAQVRCGKDDVFIVVGYSGATNTSGLAFKSVDGGVTWTPVVGLTGKEPIVKLATDKQGNWLAIVEPTKAYKSSDNGVTWVPAGTIPTSGYSPLHLVGGEANKFIFINFENASRVSNYYRTEDGGNTWIKGYTSNSYVANGEPATDGSGMWVNSMSNASNNYTLISFDNFATVNYSGGMQLAKGGGGVIAGSAGESQSGVAVWSNKGNEAKSNLAISPNPIFVDGDGCVHAHANSPSAVKGNFVVRSYDRGETWAKFARSAVPTSMGFTATADKSGVWVTVNANTLYRSPRLYNYDQSTQFKTPHAKAPASMYAYIKAKKV